jgi:hypothetical protein
VWKCRTFNERIVSLFSLSVARTSEPSRRVLVVLDFLGSARYRYSKKPQFQRNMKYKINKGRAEFNEGNPTQSSNTWPPARNPAGHQTNHKSAKSQSQEVSSSSSHAIQVFKHVLIHGISILKLDQNSSQKFQLTSPGIEPTMSRLQV